MSNHVALETISLNQLEDVTGAGFGWVKPLVKFGGKKVLGPVGWAWSAYDGTSAFLKARKEGKSVGSSLWEGAKNAVV